MHLNTRNVLYFCSIFHESWIISGFFYMQIHSVTHHSFAGDLQLEEYARSGKIPGLLSNNKKNSVNC